MKKMLTMIGFCAFLLCGCPQQLEEEYTPSLTPSPPSDSPAATAHQTEAPPAEELLASAQTTLLDKSESRLNNINIAIKEIDGYLLGPQETFSFNGLVGSRTDEKGYEEAPVIIEGEKEMEHGGGVCQISTTIYQATKKAGLEIVERHDHQRNVGYAKKGQDAAVDYGSLDFRFVNTTDFPLKIAVFMDENSLIAEIYKVY